jgi:hypothetical protein
MQSHGLGPVSTRYERSCEATPAPPFNLGRAYQFNGESCSVGVILKIENQYSQNLIVKWTSIITR